MTKIVLTLLKSPLYLIVIVLLFFFFLLGVFPWRIQRTFLKPLVAVAPLTKRWRIVLKNLMTCFPEKSQEEIEKIAKSHILHVLSMYLITFNAWHRRSIIQREIVEIQGLEHVLKANQNKQGCLLLGAHFTAMDVANIGLNEHFDLAVVYQKNTNPVLNFMMEQTRKRLNKMLIDKHDTRALFKHLREGGNLWYAPDQSYGGKMKVQIDFFGYPVNTLVAIKKVLQLGKAKLCPISFFYTPKGYVIKIHESFIDIEQASDIEVTQKYMNFVEQGAREYPDQYYWVHRRFKSVIDYKEL